MKSLVLKLLAALVLLSLIACGRPFKVETAPGFIELEGQAPDYEYRATSSDGVVFAVRTQDLPEHQLDLKFWVDGLSRSLREEGYALLETKEVASLDGTKGTQLHFGRDLEGKPFAYWLTLFVSQGRLFLIEAGAQKVAFDRYLTSLEWMHKSVKVKCGGFPAPVLASRTCNRW